MNQGVKIEIGTARPHFLALAAAATASLAVSTVERETQTVNQIMVSKTYDNGTLDLLEFISRTLI